MNERSGGAAAHVKRFGVKEAIEMILEVAGLNVRTGESLAFERAFQQAQSIQQTPGEMP
jgi:hypothetical protein